MERGGEANRQRAYRVRRQIFFIIHFKTNYYLRSNHCRRIVTRRWQSLPFHSRRAQERARSGTFLCSAGIPPLSTCQSPRMRPFGHVLCVRQVDTCPSTHQARERAHFLPRVCLAPLSGKHTEHALSGAFSLFCAPSTYRIPRTRPFGYFILYFIFCIFK